MLYAGGRPIPFVSGSLRFWHIAREKKWLKMAGFGLFGLLQQSRRDLCSLGSMKQAVFIERDGVLNAIRVEKQQQVTPLTLEDFELREDAAPLLKKLKAAGLILIATTNQPGLSRGYLSRRELDRMHERLRKAFPLDEILVCPHDETDRCPCRKPKPGYSPRRLSNGI